MLRLVASACRSAVGHTYGGSHRVLPAASSAHSGPQTHSHFSTHAEGEAAKPHNPVWDQILESVRADPARLTRLVQQLHKHCDQGPRHPPVQAFNELMHMTGSNGDMNSVFKLLEVYERTALHRHATPDTEAAMGAAFTYFPRSSDTPH